MAKLDPKHKRLADRYLEHRNGARAAREAGFKVSNARWSAHVILERPEVKAYVQAREKELNAEARLAAYLIRDELAIIAHSDIRNFVIGAKGKVTLARGVPDEAWRAVQSIEIEQIGPMTIKTKVRLWPKEAAIRMAGEHLSMFKRQLELTGKDGGPIEIDSESARLRIADRLAKLAAVAGQ